MSRERDALNVFTSIVCDGAYANIALNDSKSDAFVRALIYTALEHMSHTDYVLLHYVKGRQNRTIRNILRLAVSQILFMNRPDSAVCNEYVKLTKEVGKGALSGYVNGVLRNICRDKAEEKLPELPVDTRERLAVVTGYPRWFIGEYIERFGEQDAALALAARSDGICIRAQFPFTTEQLGEYLKNNGIEYTCGKIDSDIFRISGVDITESELFRSGSITVQSESSAVICRACGDAEGKKVLDVCAAPGGKSAYIYSLAKGNCLITACELHEHRKQLTDNTFARLHVKADTVCADMTVLRNEFADSFDIVLCDVPCSGLGVLGKPDIRYRKDAESIDELSELQYRILNTACNYVKAGGRLVYSTCTVSYRENEEIINRFLSEHTDFCGADTELLPEKVRERAKAGQFRLLPHTDGTDGFFAAVLIRKENV